MNAIQKLAARASVVGLGVTTLAATRTFAACDPNSGLKGGIDCANPGTNNNLDIAGLFHTIANTLIFIVGAVAVIMLIVGGLRYVLSGGNSAGVEGAKNTILYAIVGIIVAVAAYALVNFVLGRLGVQ